MEQQTRQTHLEFYREHQITPVRYDLSNMKAHLSRRYALYLKLGLSPLAFQKAKILEVAAGTGHNSLYLAQLMPSQLILLEPNDVGVKHIYQSYQSFEKEHTKPEIITKMLEDYAPIEPFDIVLCENWLGNSNHELMLLNKIAAMVKQQGMLVVTSVSPLGFVPNLLRRFLSIYLAPYNYEFSKRTTILLDAFDSHLKTIKSMTRNTLDWVQDNMLNPAYFGLCLSIPELLNNIGHQFDIIGSSPSFAEDWRWFKELDGDANQFNNHFLAEYWSNAHSFLDYKQPSSKLSMEINMEMEQKSFDLLKAIAKHEDAHIQRNDVFTAARNVISILDDLIHLLPEHFLSAIKGLQEVRHMMNRTEEITPESISNMTYFSSLFGRETVYVSLIRR